MLSDEPKEPVELLLLFRVVYDPSNATTSYVIPLQVP